MESCGIEKMDLATNHDLDSRQGGQATFNKRVKGLSCDNSSPSDCASIARRSACDSSILEKKSDTLELIPSTSSENESCAGGCDPMANFLCELVSVDRVEEEEEEEEEDEPFSANNQSKSCSRGAATTKRKRGHAACSLPRIVKKDIRREMSQMYANAINSADKDTVTMFFKQFCVPHCHTTAVFLHPDNPSIIVNKQMDGVDSFIKWICWHVDHSPDLSLEFSNVQIYRQAGVPGCRILMRALLSGTVIFKPNEASTDVTDTRFSPRSSPYTYYVVPNYYMLTLDAENRITQIEAVAENTLSSGFLT